MKRILSVLAATVMLSGLTPTVSAQTMTTVVSTSGIPHHDVGNYTKSPHWTSSRPRGIPDSNSWRPSIDHVLGTLAGVDADAYLHTGDMVSGRWGLDKDRPKAGIFGPTDTLAQKQAAVLKAGDLYYRQNKSWWEANGIPIGHVHFAMGDHEYGNTESDGTPRPDQLAFVGKHREIWRKHFVDGRGYTRQTDTSQQRHGSYATVLPGGIGLITLDPILKEGNLLVAKIGGPQERWLINTLEDFNADPNVDHVFVQVEIPPLGPNRDFHTGGQTLRNGARIWDILVDHDVDLILGAEWHELTMRSNGGRRPVQIVHGSQMYQGRVNYLVINAGADGSIDITARAMTGTIDNTKKMWAPHNLRAPNEVMFTSSPSTVGSLSLNAGGDITDTSGLLEEYAP